MGSATIQDNAHDHLPDGELLATIEGNGSATTTSYIHVDHLGSTNVVTNSGGATVQVLDYYPYGGKRIETGSDVSQREFIGQHFDEETDLSYLNARYYENARGQFPSEDPTFWGQQNLANPQSFNSYSYAEGNPINKKDPLGLYAEMVYRPVVFGGQTVGAHAFILISPNAGEKSISVPGYEGSSKITIGAYPSQNLRGSLNVGINDSRDYGLDSSTYLDRGGISPPNGMSVANYDRFLVKYAEVAKTNGGTLADKYWFMGSPIGPPNSFNSNNGATRIAQSTGGTFTPNQLPSGNWAPGVGTTIPTQTRVQQILSAIQQVASAFSSNSKNKDSKK